MAKFLQGLDEAEAPPPSENALCELLSSLGLSTGSNTAAKAVAAGRDTQHDAQALTELAGKGQFTEGAEQCTEHKANSARASGASADAIMQGTADVVSEQALGGSSGDS